MGATYRYREDRGAWFVYIRNGKHRESRRVGPGAKGEADAKGISEAHNGAIQAERSRVESLRSPGPKPIDQLATAWWDARHRGWPASTCNSKRSIVFARLVPQFGNFDARMLNEDRLRDAAAHWGTSKSEGGEGHSYETVIGTGVVLDSVLNWAVELGHIPRHPLVGAKRSLRAIFREVAAAKCPPRRKREAWSREEVAALLDVAEEHGEHIYGAMLFAARTGCRRGELLALDWSDVYLENSVAVIRQSLSRGQIKTTKTNKHRNVRLSPSLVAFLRDGQKVHGRVFASRRGKAITERMLDWWWRRARREAVRRAGVRPLPWHSWRHTWASLALADGWESAEAARQIGDSLDVFLDRYSHLIPGRPRSLDFIEINPRDEGWPESDAPEATDQAPPA